jgi:hypothetical protein
MNERIENLRKKYLSYAHIKKIKIESLPKVSFFSSNLDINASLHGSNSDDDNRHFFRVGS